MNKQVLAIIIALAALGAIAYFWKSAPKVDNQPAAIAPEDAALTQELDKVTTADLDKEFQDVDASLNSL